MGSHHFSMIIYIYIHIFIYVFIYLFMYLFSPQKDRKDSNHHYFSRILLFYFLRLLWLLWVNETHGFDAGN